MRRWVLLSAVLIGACGGGTTAPGAESFDGRWVGSYIVRACTPVGWASCDVALESIGSSHPMELSLSQNGSNVSGTLQVTQSPVLIMPVTGTITSGTLTLQGTVTDPVLNRVSTTSIRLTRWATIQAGSRMTGTFAVHRQTLWGPGNMEHPVGEVWTLDENAELLDVVRQTRTS